MNDVLLKKIKESDLTIEEWLKMRVTEEYEKALMNKIDELQSNWNSLRELIEKQREHYSHFKDTRYRTFLSNLLDKMNELEGKDKK